MKYDLNKATELIEKQTYYKGADAEKLASRIENLHPSLQPCVEAWLNGEEPDFEFNGVSLSLIEEKENASYIFALFRLSSLIKSPELIDAYIEMEFCFE